MTSECARYGDGANQRQHLVDGDRHGGFVAEHVVGGGVTDEQDRMPASSKMARCTARRR